MPEYSNRLSISKSHILVLSENGEVHCYNPIEITNSLHCDTPAILPRINRKNATCVHVIGNNHFIVGYDEKIYRYDPSGKENPAELNIWQEVDIPGSKEFRMLGITDNEILAYNGSRYGWTYGQSSHVLDYLTQEIRQENFLPPLSSIKKLLISAHTPSTFQLILDNSGKVYGHGFNGEGQIDPHSVDAYLFDYKEMSSLFKEPAKDIVAGTFDSYVLCESGKVMAGGLNYPTKNGFHTLPHLENIIKIDGSACAFGALNNKGEVYFSGGEGRPLTKIDCLRGITDLIIHEKYAIAVDYKSSVYVFDNDLVNIQKVNGQFAKDIGFALHANELSKINQLCHIEKYQFMMQLREKVNIVSPYREQGIFKCPTGFKELKTILNKLDLMLSNEEIATTFNLIKETLERRAKFTNLARYKNKQFYSKQLIEANKVVSKLSTIIPPPMIRCE